MKLVNDNRVAVGKFATSENLPKKYNIPHSNIYKQTYTWSALDGMTQSQIDNTLIDKGLHSNSI
jgi:hypothetical protein